MSVGWILYRIYTRIRHSQIIFVQIVFQRLLWQIEIFSNESLLVEIFVDVLSLKIFVERGVWCLKPFALNKFGVYFINLVDVTLIKIRKSSKTKSWTNLVTVLGVDETFVKLRLLYAPVIDSKFIKLLWLTIQSVVDVDKNRSNDLYLVV